MNYQEQKENIRHVECVECIGNEIGCGSCAYKDAMKALEIADILDNNLEHVTSEIIDGFPTGNVYIGMTSEDYDRISFLLRSK